MTDEEYERDRLLHVKLNRRMREQYLDQFYSLLFMAVLAVAVLCVFASLR